LSFLNGNNLQMLKKGAKTMLDIAMGAILGVLVLSMVGLIQWSNKVIEEGNKK
jgi:hypothetical protein